MPLGDVPVVPDPGPGEPDWRPLRHHLGLRSFGVNLFVARGAGDVLVPEHREDDAASAGHEELYLVLDGELEFTVDGETFPAAAGLLVAVPDLSVVRRAVARTAGAQLLAIGGPPGRPYEVSAWDRRWTAGLAQAAQGQQPPRD